MMNSILFNQSYQEVSYPIKTKFTKNLI